MSANYFPKIKKIADFHGYDVQSGQCIEECSELIQSINKFWRTGLDCGDKKTTRRRKIR